jgi:negative regulator of flagellin synthesis FlgM
MKIDRNRMANKLTQINNYNTNNKQVRESKTSKEKSVDIQISDSAKALVEKLNASDDVKYSEKVEKIRKAILEGSYEISPEKIADKLIQAMEEQKRSGI